MSIAFDSALANRSVSTTSPNTVSFTNTAGTYLLVGVARLSGGDTVTAVTYNAVGMTQLAKFGPVPGGAAGDTYIYLYGLANPATGANNIVCTFSDSGTGNSFIVAASYTGVNATGQPDASDGSGVSSGATISESITTVADNCWAIGFAFAEGGDALPTIGGTKRSETGLNSNPTIADSNAPVSPAGSYGMTFSNGSPTEPIGLLMISLKPTPSGPTGVAPNNLSLLGVG